MLLLLRSTLEQLQEKDTAQIFAEPVNIKEVRHFTVKTLRTVAEQQFGVAKWEEQLFPETLIYILHSHFNISLFDITKVSHLDFFSCL